MTACAVDIFMYNRRGSPIVGWKFMLAYHFARLSFFASTTKRRLATTAEACTANFSASKIN